MIGNDVFGNGEAQAGPFGGFPAAIHSLEFVEDLFPVLLVNADAGIRDRYQDGFFILFLDCCLNRYGAPLRCILKGIIKQLPGKMFVR